MGSGSKTVPLIAPHIFRPPHAPLYLSTKSVQHFDVFGSRNSLLIEVYLYRICNGFQKRLLLLNLLTVPILRPLRPSSLLCSQVKKAIAPWYKDILSVFEFYCLTPSQSVRGAFSIQPHQFGKMMQDAEVAGTFISVEEIGKIFVLVNFESDKVRIYSLLSIAGFL